MKSYQYRQKQYSNKQKQQQTTQYEQSNGDLFGFPLSIISDRISICSKDRVIEGQKQTLHMPHGVSVVLSTSNIYNYVNQSIDNALTLLKAYKFLFKCYTHMQGTSDVVVDVDFFRYLYSINSNKLPLKLHSEYIFKEINRKYVQFNEPISYNLSRFIVPDQSRLDLSTLILNDATKEETFKNTYLDLFDNCLSAWSTVSSRCEGNTKTKEEYKQTRVNIKRIIMLVFKTTQTTNDIVFKIACSVMFNNASLLSQHANINGVNNDMFNVVNIDKFTVEDYNKTIDILHNRTTDKVSQLLAAYLNNILKFKQNENYLLWNLDEDNRNMLLHYISDNHLDKYISRDNEKVFLQIMNRIVGLSKLRPFGLTDADIQIFETYPREKYLDYFFNKELNKHEVYSTVGVYFGLLKRYYYDDEQLSEELFNRWLSIDYYGVNPNNKLRCTELAIFIEWCLFVSDTKYTTALFKIICECPTDAREFVLNNTDCMQRHMIIGLMRSGIVSDTGFIIVPSFKNMSIAGKAITQLFVNFIDGIKYPTTNKYIIKSAFDAKYTVKTTNSIETLIEYMTE